MLNLLKPNHTLFFSVLVGQLSWSFTCTPAQHTHRERQSPVVWDIENIYFLIFIETKIFPSKQISNKHISLYKSHVQETQSLFWKSRSGSWEPKLSFISAPSPLPSLSHRWKSLGKPQRWWGRGLSRECRSHLGMSRVYFTVKERRMPCQQGLVKTKS